MEIHDWNLLLGKIPSSAWVSHAPASPARIKAVEILVGQQLPQPFRSFLQCSDGAKFGERRILGTQDLLLFLQRGCSLPDLESSSSEIRKISGVLPFHPVSRTSFECLDLRSPGAPVVWVRINSTSKSQDWVDPVKSLTPSSQIFVDNPKTPKGRRLVLEPTYLDFLDWFMDLLWTIHHPEQDLESMMRRSGSKATNWRWN